MSVTNPHNDSESQVLWHFANHHYSGLPNAHRGRASMAVGARAGAGGLRLKGMGGARGGLLDYYSFGIPPGEIRKMSVSHVRAPSPARLRSITLVAGWHQTADTFGVGSLRLFRAQISDAGACVLLAC
jgi:hypothetical protein